MLAVTGDALSRQAKIAADARSPWERPLAAIGAARDRDHRRSPWHLITAGRPSSDGRQQRRFRVDKGIASAGSPADGSMLGAGSQIRNCWQCLAPLAGPTGCV